jgi:hypothetical protein
MEIAESATVCDGCERWANHHSAAASAQSSPSPSQVDTPCTAPTVAAAPPSPAEVPAPAATPKVSSPVATAPARKAGLSRRELTIMAAAIAVGGLIMFAMMSTRGGPSTAVAASSVAPAKRASAPSAPSRPAPAATQVWSTARRGYWTANQRHTAAFELPAENTVAIWMNYVRPLLVVRCMAKKTEAFVYTGSALKIEPNTEDHGVTFRFDNDAPESTHWPDSAEHDALFAPDGVAFAHRVMAAHTLRFGYTPHNAEPVEAVFEVSGLTDLSSSSAKDCGWQK